MALGKLGARGGLGSLGVIGMGNNRGIVLSNARFTANAAQNTTIGTLSVTGGTGTFIVKPLAFVLGHRYFLLNTSRLRRQAAIFNSTG